MRTVYGPVPSRRLGISLGIDPVCSTRGNMICTFACVYCQLHVLGPVRYARRRRAFVKVDDVERDLREALERSSPGIITISGTSEPTLALNLGDIIRRVKSISGLPTAILTNSSLLPDPDVRKELLGIDRVVAKLDAADSETFQKINRPAPGLRLGEIINSLRAFRREYEGKLSLQMMFVAGNRDHAESLAELAVSIEPDDVQLDTPLRPCGVRPLPENDMAEIKKSFTRAGLGAVSIYELEKPAATPIDSEETLLRRPEE
jgi:wyosine [tRNA(Phe)-imidazoG37] synthetase (radical SAM superfamily)